MSDILIPGARDVRGTLEEPAGDPAAVVVACPPHPQHGGSRSDSRLVAVAESLSAAGIACLRFDYGPWDEGYGEREDVRNAIRWARDTDRFGTEASEDPVGVFGYSFGASQALLAAPDIDAVGAVSALAPAAQLGDDLETGTALGSLSVPVQILYGEQDSTADWEPVVERATERGDTVRSLPSDHFFVGHTEAIANDVTAFFEQLKLE